MVEKLIELIHEVYPDLKIVICEGYDCIETPDGGKGFGVYDTDNEIIYIAGDMPDPDYNIPFTILHELYHVYQKANGCPYMEVNANIFASKVCRVLRLVKKL